MTREKVVDFLIVFPSRFFFFLFFFFSSLFVSLDWL